VTVRVGEALPLDLYLDLMGRDNSLVNWYHHQGPGTVTFLESSTELEGTGELQWSTTATFSEPGDYVLRATAIESRAALVQHCCWTNGYLRVTVTP
jgi:hypothetical protein